MRGVPRWATIINLVKGNGVSGTWTKFDLKEPPEDTDVCSVLIGDDEVGGAQFQSSRGVWVDADGNRLRGVSAYQVTATAEQPTDPDELTDPE